MIPMMLLISALVFFSMQLMPVDPISYMVSPDMAMDSANIEALRESLGLNDPLIVRYLRWLGGILHGDLNPTNILYHTDDTGQYRFSLIDTNRSKFKRPTRDDCLKNLKRLTHRRELLTYITTLYARLRGWDVDRCVKQEMGYLDRYENKENFKFGLQKLLGIHHPRRVSY